MDFENSKSTSSTPIAWFILQFHDAEASAEKNILVLSDPKQAVHDAAFELDNTVFERFDRTRPTQAVPGYRLQSLTVVGIDAVEIQITFSQLVSYIRTLPASPQPSKPDLFSFGSNRVRVKFQYVVQRF